MKTIKCKDFTGLECNYEIEGSVNEDIKMNLKKHLKEKHYNLNKERLKLTELQMREVISRVDTKIMGRNTEQNYNYNKV